MSDDASPDRRHFLPGTIWVPGDDGWLVPLRRSDDPDTWLAACRSDDLVVTQVDDGNPVGGKGAGATSASTAPSLLRTMIDKLGVERGTRVLEIGTGTGLGTAWIAAIAGPENVTTVEIDREVVEHAREALRAAGCPVVPILADGRLGHPGRAPYDRVIATAAVHTVPYAWIGQTRPGGRVLLPWSSTFSAAGSLLSLAVRPDGTAQGRFGDTVTFMYLRAQRPESVWWGDDERAGDYAETTTACPAPAEVFFESVDAGFAMGVMLPGLTRGRTVNQNGPDTLRLGHFASGSWASCTPGDDGSLVRQHGPRRLWDELDSAYQWWIRAGRPGVRGSA